MRWSYRRRRLSLEELVREFAFSVVAQREAMAKGKPRRGNRFADRRAEAFDKLVSVYGDHGREALKTLLRHGDPETRGMAAVYLLRYCTDEALPVLEELVQKEKGLIALKGAEAIKRWEEGDWHLDPAPADDN